MIDMAKRMCSNETVNTIYFFTSMKIFPLCSLFIHKIYAVKSFLHVTKCIFKIAYVCMICKLNSQVTLGGDTFYYGTEKVQANFYTQMEAQCDITSLHDRLRKNLSEIHIFEIGVSNNGMDFSGSLNYTIIDARYQSVEYESGILSYRLKVTYSQQYHIFYRK